MYAPMSRFGVIWVWVLSLFVLPPVLNAQDAKETLFWTSVECESKLQVEAYLEVYPGGAYVDEAQGCLEGQLGLDREERILVQQGLASLEYPAGVADGLFGPATRRAIREWQAAKEFAAAGYLTREQADALIAQGQDAVAAAEQRQREEARRQAEAAAQRQEEETRRQAEAARKRREAERQRQEEARQQAEAVQKRPQPGEVFRDCPTCPEMVVVPAGTFRMGSPSYEEYRDEDEGPMHRVTIAKPFAVGVYEVTVGEFGRFVDATGHATRNWCSGLDESDDGRNWQNPGYRQSERHPVVCVSWDDAQAYVGWLTQQTDKAYRLLSEAEWEYVARAGTTTTYHWGDRIERDRANCDGCGSRWDDAQAAPGGSFTANGWGVHDLHGNVWEWVADCWNNNYYGAPTDGSTWTSGDCGTRIARGGSWFNAPSALRAAARDSWLGTRWRDNSGGFRIARSLE